MSAPQLPRWKSLRVRLPLLVCGTTTVVIAVFLAVTWQALQRTMREVGASRTSVAAEQVASLLTQAAVRGVGETRRLAGSPVLREYIVNGSGDADRIRKLLAVLAAPAQPPVELWKNSGELLMAVSVPGGPAGEPEGKRSYPAETGLSPFRLHADTVTYELVTDVIDPAAADEDAEPVGRIVVRRNFVGAPNSDAMGRLVGAGAVVLLGNRDDDVWTDLKAAAAPPQIDTTADGVAEYTDEEGRHWIGTLKLIASTPWAVWVGFPDDVILGSARTLFRGMMLFAIVLVTIATALIAVASARLVRPLQELTSAAEAVAGGDFSRRVQADREDEVGRVGLAFNAMAEQVATAQRTLEDRVQERTLGLQRVNQELEAFTYSVSHDLRAPLRHVVGFAGLLRQSGASLSETEQRYLNTIVSAATRMGALIDDLLAFSRVGRTALNLAPTDLNQIVREAKREVTDQASGTSTAAWVIGDLPVVNADRAMIRLAFVNLLSNALKYSSMRTPPRIEIGATRGEREVIVFVRDNGVGFDMAYVDKLFGVFQRLHRHEEFEGTGIGLANVRRIVERHGGRTWAEGQVDAGAVFYMALPDASLKQGGAGGN